MSSGPSLRACIMFGLLFSCGGSAATPAEHSSPSPSVVLERAPSKTTPPSPLLGSWTLDRAQTIESFRAELEGRGELEADVLGLVARIVDTIEMGLVIEDHEVAFAMIAFDPKQKKVVHHAGRSERRPEDDDVDIESGGRGSMSCTRMDDADELSCAQRGQPPGSVSPPLVFRRQALAKVEGAWQRDLSAMRQHLTDEIAAQSPGVGAASTALQEATEAPDFELHLRRDHETVIGAPTSPDSVRGRWYHVTERTILLIQDDGGGATAACELTGPRSLRCAPADAEPVVYVRSLR